jgi:hypothetical protein
MRQRPLRAIAMVLIVLAGAACGTAAPSASPSPAAATFEEADAAVCAAFGSMLRAVGNPDTGAPSVLSKALDDAVAAGDVVAAERAAASITSELETGRQQAAAAGRWPSAGPSAVAMDTLLVAFEAVITAKRAAAAHTPGAVDPQTAFAQAGGVEAWTAMLQAISTMPVPAGATRKPCPAFSGTP